jgi:tetratricopeptide (TPR) repeat protein
VFADPGPADRGRIDSARGHDIAYLLEGTMQFDPADTRADWRLVDLEDGGKIVWTRRSDRAGDDLASALDPMAAPIAAAVPFEIMRAEAARWQANAGIPAHVLAYRAITLAIRYERDDFARSGEMLAHAIASHPEYAAAHAYRAMWYLMEIAQGWSIDPASDAARGVEAAERAIVLDPHAGHVRAFLGEGLLPALSLHDRSLELNPHAPMPWALSALTLAYLGRYREAEERYRRCLALLPYGAFHYYFDSIGCTVKLQQRDYAAAVVLGRASARSNPNFIMSHVPYLSALGHLGDTREAAEVLPRMRAIAPNLTLAALARRSRFEAAEDREHYVEGLRLAGLS